MWNCDGSDGEVNQHPTNGKSGGNLRKGQSISGDSFGCCWFYHLQSLVIFVTIQMIIPTIGMIDDIVLIVMMVITTMIIIVIIVIMMTVVIFIVVGPQLRG